MRDKDQTLALDHQSGQAVTYMRLEVKDPAVGAVLKYCPAVPVVTDAAPAE